MPASNEDEIVDASALLSRHISEERLAPYLQAVRGDKDLALDLYRWNITLSGAVYEALHIVEVVLRNAMDRQLRVWNSQQNRRDGAGTYTSDWLLDPAPLLRRLVRPAELAKVKTRADRAVRRRRAVVHGDLVAQLSFGTWRYLLPDRDPGRRLLWREALELAFPHVGRPGAVPGPDELVSAVDDLYQLRNRVAHLEPLLQMAVLRRQLRRARAVLIAIEPLTCSWFDAGQRVTAVAERRPTSPWTRRS